MKNKNNIFVIASVVFGVLALVTIFLGVGSLYHSAYRDFYNTTTGIPTVVSQYTTYIPTQIAGTTGVINTAATQTTGGTVITSLVPTVVGPYTSYIPEPVSREWFELTKVATIKGLDIIFGGSVQTQKYGLVSYEFSIISLLPYVFVALAMVFAILKLTVKKLDSRYMNVLIALLFIIGAGLFLVQIPAAKLSAESAERISEICKIENDAIREQNFIDELLTVRQVLKPSLINYLGVAASFVASILAILPFFFGLGKEEETVA